LRPDYNSVQKPRYAPVAGSTVSTSCAAPVEEGLDAEYFQGLNPRHTSGVLDRYQP
jgi:hypothetical protein